MRCSECGTVLVKDTTYNPSEPVPYRWVCYNDSCPGNIEGRKIRETAENLRVIACFPVLLLLLGIKVLFWIWFIRMVVANDV